MPSRNKVEFHFANRHLIPFFATHFCKLFDNPTQAQYFLEILHGIGVVQHDVSTQHVHQTAYDDEHAVLVAENFKAQIFVGLIGKFFVYGYGFNGIRLSRGARRSIDVAYVARGIDG